MTPRQIIGLLPQSWRKRLTIGLVNIAEDEVRLAIGAQTLPCILRNMRRIGFSPSSIFDIGAYRGEWTKQVSSIFHNATFVMIEAQPQKLLQLEDMASKIGSDRVKVISALLGSVRADAVTFNLMETGSSVLTENTSFSSKSILLQMTTLDNVIDENNLQAPGLVKIDAQGYELEILKGSQRALQSAEACLLETSLIEYNKGAPLIAETVRFMSSQGFVVYDLCGQSRRQSDSALFQLDIMFVKETSITRQTRKFWNNEPLEKFNVGA